MNTKEELIFQALGAASMCWTGSPSGVFDSTRCKQIGDELIAALDTAEALKPSHNTGSPKCEQCIHWNVEHGHHEIECYSCKRYHVDLFTLRAGA